jgi:hypothetical protein
MVVRLPLLLDPAAFQLRLQASIHSQVSRTKQKSASNNRKQAT